MIQYKGKVIFLTILFNFINFCHEILGNGVSSITEFDNNQQNMIKTATNSLSSSTLNHWLLPDGVSDLLSVEAVKQETLRHDLLVILQNHGYQLINPPLIEYTESLLAYATEDLKRQTFKIIDQITGRLMGVRADMTPQIARIDAHASDEKSVARYCYAGHVIYTLPKGLFGSRTPLMIGAEIFGADGLNADIELLNILFHLLDSTNLLSQCHIDMGHVAIFQTLSELANLSTETQEKLIHLYGHKALPELKNVCDELAEMGNPYANDFYILGEYSHSVALISEQLSDLAKQNPVICQALDDLTTLNQYVQQHWQIGVSIDVTELKSYHYHTGLVFNVFVANESLPIVRGGRFSNPHTQTLRPAIGFSCDLTRWQNHLEKSQQKLVFVPFDVVTQYVHDAKLQTIIGDLRKTGVAVVVALSENDKPNATHELRFVNGEWQQVVIVH